MSKAYTEISAGLDDAIRKKTGMSQQQFCATFGISLGALRHWEQGLRMPRGAARVLLKVVDKNPKAVIKAIGD